MYSGRIGIAVLQCTACCPRKEPSHHINFLSKSELNADKDIELCVPASMLSQAEATLCSTGLFVRESLDDFDLYTEYKRGFPRLRSTSWSSPNYSVMIFPDTMYGLCPVEKNFATPISNEAVRYSSQIMDLLSDEQIRQLPWPRLSSLFTGRCQRYLDTNDAVAMTAAEQLVDCLNLDASWCEKNLLHAKEGVLRLAKGLVQSKAARLDDFCTGGHLGQAATEDLSEIPGFV